MTEESIEQAAGFRSDRLNMFAAAALTGLLSHSNPDGYQLPDEDVVEFSFNFGRLMLLISDDRHQEILNYIKEKAK